MDNIRSIEDIVGLYQARNAPTNIPSTIKEDDEDLNVPLTPPKLVREKQVRVPRAPQRTKKFQKVMKQAEELGVVQKPKRKTQHKKKKVVKPIDISQCSVSEEDLGDGEVDNNTDILQL